MHFPQGCFSHVTLPPDVCDQSPSVQEVVKLVVAENRSFGRFLLKALVFQDQYQLDEV